MSMNDNLLRRALTDAETGLGNAAYLRLQAESAVDRAERYGFPLSLVSIRCAGEDQIVALARQIAARVRRSDCLARTGPGELTLLLTHLTRRDAERVAERLREEWTEETAEPPPRATSEVALYEERDHHRLLDVVTA